MTEKCYNCGCFITKQQALDYGTCDPCAIAELVEVCEDLGKTPFHQGESDQARLSKTAEAARSGKLSSGQIAELWHDLILGVPS